LAQELLVVLFGGQSPEHEVSCASAQSIVAQADPGRFRLELLAITKAGDWVRPEGQGQQLSGQQLSAAGKSVNVWAELKRIRAQQGVVFPALHGPKGEDGTVQGLFELAGVAYVGSGVKASAVCMDKITTKQILQAAGLPVVPYVVFNPDADPPGAAPQATPQAAPDRLADIAQQLGFPMFVKPANQGSSIGVSRAQDFQQLEESVGLAASYSQEVLLEPAISGREIECALLGSLRGGLKAAVPGEIIPGAEFYSYDDKYVSDQAQLLVPAPLSSNEQQTFQDLAIEAGYAIGVEGLARVDFLWDERQRPLISEINTMPGFTTISLYPKTWEASGLGFGELIGELYDLAKAKAVARRVAP